MYRIQFVFLKYGPQFKLGNYETENYIINP